MKRRMFTWRVFLDRKGARRRPEGPSRSRNRNSCKLPRWRYDRGGDATAVAMRPRWRCDRGGDATRARKNQNFEQKRCARAATFFRLSPLATASQQLRGSRASLKRSCAARISHSSGSADKRRSGFTGYKRPCNRAQSCESGRARFGLRFVQLLRAVFGPAYKICSQRLAVLSPVIELIKSSTKIRLLVNNLVMFVLLCQQ